MDSSSSDCSESSHEEYCPKSYKKYKLKTTGGRKRSHKLVKPHKQIPQRKIASRSKSTSTNNLLASTSKSVIPQVKDYPDISKITIDDETHSNAHSAILETMSDFTDDKGVKLNPKLFNIGNQTLEQFLLGHARQETTHPLLQRSFAIPFPRFDASTKLNVDNYTTWKSTLDAFFAAQEIGYVFNDDPTTWSIDEKRINSRLAGIAMTTLSSEIIVSLSEAQKIDYWALMKHLKSQAYQMHDQRAYQLERDLIKMEFSSQSGSLRSFFANMTEKMTRYNEIAETKMDDSRKKKIMLEAIKNHPDFSAAYTFNSGSASKSLSFEELKNHLLATPKFDNQHQAGYQATDVANVANKHQQISKLKKPSPTFFCKFHKRYVHHTTENCLESKRSSSKQKQYKDKGNVAAIPELTYNEDSTYAYDFDDHSATLASHETDSLTGHVDHRKKPLNNSSEDLRSVLGVRHKVVQNIHYTNVMQRLDCRGKNFKHSAARKLNSNKLSLSNPQTEGQDFAESSSKNPKRKCVNNSLVSESPLIHFHNLKELNSQPNVNNSREFQHVIHKTLRGSDDQTNQQELNKTNLLYKNHSSVAFVSSENQGLNKSELRNESVKEFLWIIDSGASSHMTAHLSLLSNFSPSYEQKYVTIADGSKLLIEGHGEVSLMFKYQNTLRTLKLHNVAFVPGFNVNLLSVKALISDRNIKYVSFDQTFVRLQTKTNESIPIAKAHKSLYIFPQVVSDTYKSTPLSKNEFAHVCIHEWHKRTAHKHLDHVKKLAKALNFKVSKCDCDNDCEGCLKAKFHAQPFPQCSAKPDNPLDLVCSDIGGPEPLESLNGSIYYITITDACTDFTVVQTLRRKSDARIAIMNYFAWCKNCFNKYPSIFRSDNGGEFLGNELTSFMENNGIKHQRSTPYKQQQNGIAERKNRTLGDGMRAVLYQRQLPHFLWGEAINYVNDTFNSIPKKGQDKCPIDNFGNKSMQKAKFFEFGAPVYFETSPVSRTKLDPRGQSGLFMGYDHQAKAYRILKNRRIHIAHAITFVSDRLDDSEFNTQVQVNKNPSAQSQDVKTADMTRIFCEQTTSNDFPELRRSERIASKALSAQDSKDFVPKSYDQAIKCKEANHWVLAMEREMRALEDHNTWSVTELPQGRKAFGHKWVFKHKKEAGTIVGYKARLVANGYSQVADLDYDEIFAPVTRSATVRTMLALAGKLNWSIYQYDVDTAFLNGDIDKDIYMKCPKGFGFPENSVLKLQKSLYGLKQSARKWNEKFHKTLIDIGFKQSKADSCLYSYKHDEDTCYLICHVDDFLLSGPVETIIHNIASKIHYRFSIKAQGKVSNFLNIKISYENGSYNMNQAHYIETIATEFSLDEASPSKYPLDVGYYKLTDDKELEDITMYRKLIGMLLYVSTNTRPDIAVSVGILSQRLTKPRLLDMNEAKRIVKYLFHTRHYKLKLNDTTSDVIRHYSDADWANDPSDRKSISGCFSLIFGGAILWTSRKQTNITLSSTEAEFYALAETVKEAKWLYFILKDFNINVDLPIPILVDNMPTINYATNNKFSNNSKHIDIRLKFVHEFIKDNFIKLYHVGTKDNLADCLTKPLNGEALTKHRKLMNLIEVQNELKYKANFTSVHL